MRQRSAVMAFLLGSLTVGATSSLTMLAACDDLTTGQDPEPPGPLLVTRLTLDDPNGDNSAGAPVFTDTSAPLDCSLDSLKNTTACTSTPFKDMYSPMMSPPTPDSGMKLRVVFNKAPLKLNGQDVESTPSTGLAASINDLQLTDPNVLQLQCDGAGCAVPPSYNSLQITGSDLSPVPTLFDYGPALQMQIFTSASMQLPMGLVTSTPDDPVRALEPGTVYHVILNPGLSGRDLDPLQFDASAMALLTFTTEVFHPIRFGIGDATDPFVTGNSCAMGSGAVTDPYIVSAIPSTMPSCTTVNPANNAALVVYLNAGVDDSVFQSTTATASIAVNGGTAMPVPVKLATNINTVLPGAGAAMCSRGNQRALYIAPTSGHWDATLASTDMAVVKVTLTGADIRDVSQAAGHPAGQGRHTLSGDVVLQATITPADIAVVPDPNNPGKYLESYPGDTSVMASGMPGMIQGAMAQQVTGCP